MSNSEVQFRCPACQALLRSREESELAEQFDCPDCRSPLSLKWLNPGEVVVSLKGQTPASSRQREERTSSPKRTKPLDVGLSLEASTGKRTAASNSGATGSAKAAVLSSGATGSASAGAIMPRRLCRGQDNPPRPNNTATAGSESFEATLQDRLAGPRSSLPLGLIAVCSIAVAVSIALWNFWAPFTGSVDEQGPGEEITESVQDPENIEIPDSEEVVLPRDFKLRMKILSGQIIPVKKDGNFPLASRAEQGLLPKDEFSWIAVLASRHQWGTRVAGPVWDRGWLAPINEGFVRRSLPEVQNPTVFNQAGDDGYPATHVVGMTGIGEDAYDLPLEHPRAGIFGRSRTVREKDLHKGKSNTILLASVEAMLGSWAAAGAPTARGFVDKPYIQGPDGFGNGVTGNMIVVLADGSVQLVNSKIDPAILESQAVLGNPSREPEEPVAQNPPEEKKTDDPEVKNPDPPPTEEEPPAVVAQLDIPKQLQQKLTRYEQSKPIPLTDFLAQFEELSGVSVRFDRDKLGIKSARLDQKIAIKLENKTLQDLLAEVLNQAELSYELREDHIELVQRPE